MQRGFKTKCENLSLELRRTLGLKKTDPLIATQLASHLGVILLTPEKVKKLSQKSLECLLDKEKKSWSAVTISCNGTDVIVYNPTHSNARQSSDLMHELAHVILTHDPGKIYFLPMDVSISLREYNQEQEEEADWLAGCLLLPREALTYIKYRRISNDSVRKTYFVSQHMLTYRMNKTGVNQQFRNM